MPQSISRGSGDFVHRGEKDFLPLTTTQMENGTKAQVSLIMQNIIIWAIKYAVIYLDQEQHLRNFPRQLKVSQFSFSFLFKGAPVQSYVRRHSLIYLRDLRGIRDMPVAHQHLNVDQDKQIKIRKAKKIAIKIKAASSQIFCYLSQWEFRVD